MTMECPVWLKDEPEIVALLHAVLDRFDHQSGDTRQKAMTLRVDQYLPSLARADAAADQCWALLQALQQHGVLSIRAGRRSVYDPEWQGAKLAFLPQSEELLRKWLRRAPSERVMDVWRRAVSEHARAFPGGCDALAARRIVIGDRTSEEVVAALARIGELAGPITLRQLSAHVFWGDSKVLDDRHDLIAALFPALEIQDRAIVVAVFLPEACSGVLFIENQDTYTAATRGVPTELRNLGLVYASGFRSSAARIRTRPGALLHYAGPGAASEQGAFERWWFDGGEPARACHFWGDLDFAGMQILRALRQRFGEVTAWQPGYAPMLEMLRRSGGYRVGGEAAGQADPVATGCSFADDELLPAIREFGQIDQESLLSP